MMENELMKKTVIVTAIGSFSAQNVISACHKAGMRVVGCDIYPCLLYTSDAADEL